MKEGQLAAILQQLRRAAAVDAGIANAELLQRFVAHRDEVSFELLMWRHARLVWNVCRRVLQNYHDAEDAFQVTFLALARQAGRIKKSSCLAGWLYQVAFRAALTARERRIKRRESSQAIPEFLVVTNGEQKLSEEDRTALDQEIYRLPERFQIPVVLCYLEGKTVSETALLLGWPRGTVASRLARARRRLHTRLARRGFEFTSDLPSYTRGDRTPLAIPVLAKQVIAGAAKESLLAPQVASLTKEVMKAMFLSKIKTQAILGLTVLGLLFAGGGWAIHLYAVSPEGPNNLSAEEPQTQKAGESTKPKPPAQAGRKTVTVIQPARREATPYADYQGRLVALQRVEIQPTVSGRLEKVLFQGGADVKNGDLLFEIESKSYELALEKAEAELERIERQVTQKEIDLKRAGDLVKKGYSSEREIIKAEGDVSEAKAAVRQALIERHRAKMNLAACKITAPMDGRIGEPSVHPGSQVHAGDKPTVLTTITVLDPIGVNFDMDERNFLRYRRLMREKKVKGPGSPVSIGVSDEEGFPREGIISGFGDQIVPETGTIRVRGKLANPDGLLLPGMFTNVRMKVGPPGQVADLSARWDPHYDNQGRAYLLVVNDQNRIEMRFVKWDQVLALKTKLSDHSADKTEVFMSVTEGLHPDDWVIISDVNGLEPGQEVEVKRVKSDSKK
jgi:RND family efflux transporter MFP subunit